MEMVAKPTKMKTYTTLENEKYYLEQLPPKHQEFLTEVLRYFDQAPPWDDFDQYWLSRGKKVWGRKKWAQIIELPIYKICQDLEALLGIKQGYTRERDYRDELQEMISRNFSSCYQFCRVTGIDQGFLSNVFKKRKNISITVLENALHKIGYKLSIQRDKSTREKVSSAV